MSQATKEQLKIVESINENDLVKVDSVSGSGKTSTLLLIAESLKEINGKKFKAKYMAYNKAIAEEAGQKFEGYVDSSTIHSIAYRAIVNQLGLKVRGFIKASEIKERIEYIKKILIIEIIEQYCLSGSTSIEKFAMNFQADLDKQDIKNIKKYFGLMKDGKFPCTHSFYLKIFHLLIVQNLIKIEPVDLLMLDEAGDVNPVTLDIFTHYPAKKKVMVGDKCQNIYSFNNTVNGFKELSKEGKILKLTKSFRVSEAIARKIEPFCQTYLDEEMEFKGFHYDHQPMDDIATHGFISRTNGALIGKMIELDLKNERYNLTRSIKAMFEVPLMIMSLREGIKIFNKDYKFLEDDVEEYFDSRSLQIEYNTIFKYIMSIHSDDISIKSACALIIKYGPAQIRETYEKAKSHAIGEDTHLITLTTAHSSKGLNKKFIVAH